MSSIKIRQLFEEDWEFVRSIRLHALKQAADVFLSNYDKESAYDAETWKNRLRSDEGATFGLFDNDKIVGLTGIFTWKGDETGKTAILAMSFIDAAYRGKGYSKLFYEARIAWAKQKASFDKIRVSHREGNEASRRANQAFGFEYKSKEIVDWPDGSKDFEHIYEMDLRK